MEDIHHTYGNLNRFNRFVLFLLSILFIAAGLISFVVWLRALINHNSSASIFFWYFLGYAVWSPFVFTFLSYLTPEIVADEEGLRTKFLFKTLVVKWEGIAEVKLSRPFGARVGKKARVLIAKDGLTFFHRIYGLVYGQANRPALVIWSHGNNYDGLIKKISKNKKEERFRSK